MERLSYREDILRLYSLGKTRREIERELKCSIHCINKHLKGSGYRGEVNEKKQLVICLRMDGYYLDEVVEITKLARQTVIEYSKGHKFVSRPVKIEKIKKPKVMPRKKKNKKDTPTQIEQRSVLGQGVEAGVYTRDVKLRENRDEGRLVKLLYSDLSDNPTVSISIRVKDNVSDQEAADRWGKRFGKKSWRLVCG